MKTILILGALPLILGACTAPLSPFPDVTAPYVQEPTPLPDVAAIKAADNATFGSAAVAAEHPFADYRRRGVVDPLDWRRLNAEQAPMQGMNH